MIVFDLECRAAGHRFEGWFSTNDDYERQRAAGMLSCPVCGADDVAKAVMAPNVGRKGNQLPEPARATPQASAPIPVASSVPPLPPEAVAMLRAVALAQAEAIKSSRWVGDRFADQARAMHYGERDHEPIHGQATPAEARELIEEGVPVAPLLIPVVPPDQAN
ncbi:DUF1178 family protein [Novosphingobium piscinae]|uniref:DUF1178 family protein n=1 Tax=Novosphingobium piscinae TaxID=1507448 RepID=A0A7X1FZ53_9SPHN|nr:DUF1178 family protein [Novosphingobium piscinae]MBC2669651.1 DUF1178 family protein [Novosphingobium piscinae]